MSSWDEVNFHWFPFIFVFIFLHCSSFIIAARLIGWYELEDGFRIDVFWCQIYILPAHFTKSSTWMRPYDKMINPITLKGTRVDSSSYSSPRRLSFVCSVFFVKTNSCRGEQFWIFGVFSSSPPLSFPSFPSLTSIFVIRTICLLSSIIFIVVTKKMDWVSCTLHSKFPPRRCIVKFRCRARFTRAHAQIINSCKVQGENNTRANERTNERTSKRNEEANRVGLLQFFLHFLLFFFDYSSVRTTAVLSFI